jgi:hypothetical protein
VTATGPVFIPLRPGIAVRVLKGVTVVVWKQRGAIFPFVPGG